MKTCNRMNLDKVFQDINFCHTKLSLQLSHEKNIRNIKKYIRKPLKSLTILNSPIERVY